MSAVEKAAEVLRERVTQVLLDEGASPGSSIHSWRCEYPDRYGPCRCVEETAAEIVAALDLSALLAEPTDQGATRTEWALLRPDGTQATEVITTEDKKAARQWSRGYTPPEWRLHRREVQVGPWVEAPDPSP